MMRAGQGNGVLPARAALGTEDEHGSRSQGTLTAHLCSLLSQSRNKHSFFYPRSGFLLYLLLQQRGQVLLCQPLIPVLSVSEVQGSDGDLLLLPQRGGLHLVPPLLNLHVDVLRFDVRGDRQDPIHLHPQCLLWPCSIHRVDHLKAFAPLLAPPGPLPLQLSWVGVGGAAVPGEGSGATLGGVGGVGTLLSQGLLDGAELSPVKGLGSSFSPALPCTASLLLRVQLCLLRVLLLAGLWAGLKG